MVQFEQNVVQQEETIASLIQALIEAKDTIAELNNTLTAVKGSSQGSTYGAEYQTNTYCSWTYLHDHDVPCAVCRITRTDVLMVPARNVCPKGYILEYKGYLMGDRYSYSTSEFICVDDKPETVSGGNVNSDGSLFYFVESVCGSHKCPPYSNGMELTCTVCSFSPVVDSFSLQPFA